ncbi:uncharacterized protein LOC127291617 [Leptopilina boulardi]|uniref:uncharacterized protein LOC127291617 n=1 Tax=Leptopilina boulardi TaxID=63433 RepID=UPI0021F5C022|nr:uncharacterized protein LOC127291617 [Leptopilina boulardi]
MPNSLIYETDNDRMRKHLKLIFENNRLNPFPSVRSSIIRNSIVEDDWNCLLINRAEELQTGGLNPSYFYNSFINNNANRVISTQHLEIKRSLNDASEKKRIGATNNNVNKVSPQTEDEKKIRKERNVAYKRKKLAKETEEEKKVHKEKDLSPFASIGAKLEIPKGNGPYIYRVHGQVYHNTYALHPDGDDNRKYGQLYIIDTNEAVLERLKNKSNKKCLSSLMEEIDKLLREINPYAKAFKMMREVELEEEALAKSKNEPIRNIQMWIKRDRSLNQSKFNVPSCSEVALVFVSEDGEPPMELQEFGKPNLFITMTCNPKWREITENLLDIEIASDRPDIVTRVFQQKVKEIMKDIKEKEIFGPILAFVYVIEFQKRGLPHVHLIIFLRNPIRDAETLHKMICAEIPDETKNPELFKIVKQFQVHGPCGKENMNSPCMDPEKKVCTKNYPKPFCSETTYGSKNYPELRRRNDGYKDDNEEMKYDEIVNYLNTRYVCPPEAMHRLFEFNMHEQSHTTYRLAVHLPNQQLICFKEGLEEEAVNKFKNTTLTAWFKLNRENPEARKYLYTEIPHKYVFVESSKTWKIRERITKPIICRMYFVSPKDVERYFLRVLLLYVRGAKSFEDVRTYEGITYNTFVEAVRARNLIVDDSEWDNCLAEAVSMKFPKELCRLFAYICVFGLPVNAIDLWNKYKEHMVFDNNVPVEVATQKALILINEVLNFHGFSLNKFGLPNIDQKIIDDYISVDKKANELSLKLLKEESEVLIKSLNNDQRKIFDDVMAAIHNDDCKNRYFFVSAPGGCGKSYLENTIIATLESEELVVLAVA